MSPCEIGGYSNPRDNMTEYREGDLIMETGIRKRLLAVLLTGAVAVSGMTMTPAIPVKAAASAMVYSYSDKVAQNGYLYYIRSNVSTDGSAIYRMKVATGAKSKLLTTDQAITNMLISGETIYYTTYDSSYKSAVTYTADITGSDAKKYTNGSVVYADSKAVYTLTSLNSGKTRLYFTDLATAEKTPVKTTSSEDTMDYITDVEGNTYYYQYDSSAQKLILYEMKADKAEFTRIAVDKLTDTENTYIPMITDVKKLDGEIFYDYGTYQGTGNFWYGVIKHLTSTGKKVVSKSVGTDKLLAGDAYLYYSDATQNKNYRYNYVTGKKNAYTLDYEKGVGYSILGDKTYMSDVSNTSTISISRFTSGTARQTLTKNFIRFSYKQNSKLDYSVEVSQTGAYNLVCVTGTDYNDTTAGWRGKTSSIKWYVTDGSGAVLSSFN